MSNRSIYIDSYIEQITANNIIYRNMLDIMSNQENTLRRLIFEPSGQENSSEPYQNYVRFTNPVRQPQPHRFWEHYNTSNVNTRRNYTSDVRRNNGTNGTNENINNLHNDANTDANTDTNTDANTDANTDTNTYNYRYPDSLNISQNTSNNYFNRRSISRNNPYSYSRELNSNILNTRRYNSPIDNVLTAVGHNILNTIRRETNDYVTNLELENVPVIPNENEIEHATQTIQFNNIINPPNSTCPISLTRFEPDSSANVLRIRHCGHIFVPEQLQIWFTHNCRCPLCRYDIRTFSIGRGVFEPLPNDNNDGNDDNDDNNDNDNNENDNDNNENDGNDGNDGNHTTNYVPVFSRTFQATTMQGLVEELSNIFGTDINTNNTNININELFSIQVEGLVERDTSNN